MMMMNTTKRCYDQGHPPSSKRARCNSNNCNWPRPTLSAEACRQRLASPHSAEEALDALLECPELLQSYMNLPCSGPYFYLAYALAQNKQSVTVAHKCLQVLAQVLTLGGSKAALQATGVVSYIQSVVRLYPQQLGVLGQALSDALRRDPTKPPQHGMEYDAAGSVAVSW